MSLNLVLLSGKYFPLENFHNRVAEPRFFPLGNFQNRVTEPPFSLAGGASHSDARYYAIARYHS